jgi:S-(hydroxymethyl)glutathione dehydrogenase/alcohol dehydrogenase
MQMRAAVLEEFGQPLSVQEIQLAQSGPGEVLVLLVAYGVCHTDRGFDLMHDQDGIRSVIDF